jgi:hypothetical protein
MTGGYYTTLTKGTQFGALFGLCADTANMQQGTAVP